MHAHRRDDVWNVIDTAVGAHLQPMILGTSTAGVDIGGICYRLLGQLQGILEGTFVDESVFGIYYTLDPGDDWRDPASLRKANPNYGVSVDPDDLARKVRAAERSPAGVNNFLTKHCNLWVRAESTWMPMDEWHACGQALRLEDFAGVACYLGIDLAETRDIMAKARVFVVAEAEQPALFERLLQLARPGTRPSTFHVVLPTFYLPAAAVEQSPTAELPGWVRGGHIIETLGNIADFARLEADVLDDCARYDVREICFDRALAAAVMQSLQRTLGDEPPVIVIKQSVDVMDPAMKAVERLVLGRTLVHDANPAFAWMVSNVVVERNYKDEIYPRKAGGKDSHNKIDGAVALFNAIARAYQPGDAVTSAYSDGHGLMVI